LAIAYIEAMKIASAKVAFEKSY